MEPMFVREETLTPEVRELTSDLGRPTAILSPGLANPVAGMVLSALLLCGGAGFAWFMYHEAALDNFQMPFYAEKGNCWLGNGLCFALGLGIAAGGILLGIFAIGLFRAQTIICPAGLIYAAGKSAEVYRWDDLSQVEEVICQKYFPLKFGLKYLLPMGQDYSYRLQMRDGREVAFTGNTVAKVRNLGAVIRERASERSVQWTVTHTSN